jgi:hypothetical protein
MLVILLDTERDECMKPDEEQAQYRKFRGTYLLPQLFSSIRDLKGELSAHNAVSHLASMLAPHARSG